MFASEHLGVSVYVFNLGFRGGRCHGNHQNTWVCQCVFSPWALGEVVVMVTLVMVTTVVSAPQEEQIAHIL